MKTRSKSIQTAINVYNEAALALHPPCQTVNWEQVVEYSFLGEFDLLRDTREDVRLRKWATPANRLLMLQFFKLIRAEEELPRLHLEIRRLLTYMRDEQEVFHSKAQVIEATDPGMAWQLHLHWGERGRFDALHRRRLFAIKSLKGFEVWNARYFWRGTSVVKEDVVMTDLEGNDEVPLWKEGEDGGEDEEADLAERVEMAMNIAAE